MDCRIREAYKSEETYGDFPGVPRSHRLRSLLSVMLRFLSMLGPVESVEVYLRWASRGPRVQSLGWRKEQGFTFESLLLILSNHSLHCD
jgi:hypothetical protein